MDDHRLTAAGISWFSTKFANVTAQQSVIGKPLRWHYDYYTPVMLGSANRLAYKGEIRMGAQAEAANLQHSLYH
jgi:hypothetical protein